MLPKDNHVFISYAHEDAPFAKRFCKRLQHKLGDSIPVWMDEGLKNGREWRREIQAKLDTASLVVVILSPSAIKSLWVIYEWHYSLLVLQSEPYLVYLHHCEDEDLNRFMDFQLQLKAPLAQSKKDTLGIWKDKRTEVKQIVNDVVERVQDLPKLQALYSILTDEHLNDGGNPGAPHIAAARELAEVPEDLALAAANYLLQALDFWMSSDNYGPVLGSIADALGRLGKRKAIPAIGQLFGHTTDVPNVLSAAKRALYLLSCERPL
jgi:hypothetical protein